MKAAHEDKRVQSTHDKKKDINKASHLGGESGMYDHQRKRGDTRMHWRRDYNTRTGGWGTRQGTI